MAPREGLDPAPAAVRRRAVRRIAGAYFLFALAWIVISDLALLDLTKDLPGFAGASLIKGGAFVLVTTALLYFLISHSLRSIAEPGSHATDSNTPQPARLNPAILFGVMAALAIALVIAMFSYEGGRHREHVRKELNAILELKADQIELLLAQRQATARSYSRSRGLREDMTRLARRPDPKVVQGVARRIEDLRRDLELDAVLVLGPAGQLVAAAGPEELRGLSPELAAEAVRSMASSAPVSHFLHRDTRLPGEPIFLDYVTPLDGALDQTRTVGAIVLRENARGRFFRLIQNWPFDSATAETLLVRRDGDEVLYLSEVRHATDTAFRIRQPLSEIYLIVVRAVNAAGSLLMDGTDYRGASVVAASRPIAGTEWFLIAKVDRDEVLAPVRRSAVIWLLSILCMTLLAAVGIGFIWRQQLRLVAAGEIMEATARERAEVRLSAAEERYRALFERSLDCVFLVDLEGNFLDANHAALELLGYRREEIPSVNFRHLLNPADLQRALARMKEVVGGAPSQELSEYALRRKDGTEIIAEVRTTLVYEDGRIGAVLGTARDVTQRKRAAAALQESENRFRQMADTIGEVFWMAPPDITSITYVSPGFEKVWGWTPAELYADPNLWKRAIHADDAPSVVAGLERLAQGGSYDVEFRITRRDGNLRWINDRGYALRDDVGRVILTTGVASDITGRKHSEFELRESEQRFRAMIEQSVSGFYMIQDGHFIYVNSRFAEIFGYAAPEDVIGKTPSDLTAPKDRATVAGNIQRRLTGEVKDIGYSFTGLHKDGTEFDVGVHGSFAVHEGRPAIIGLLQDISERKHAEEDSSRYIARLEQAMQSTINVVATIGELRDPYTHGHERRVGEIAAAIATEMGLPDNQVEGIRVAGYLHDVGKIAVPAEILAKPTKLTKAEFNLVKDHAQQSYEILKTVPFPWPVAEAAWEHHERFDGSGYPRGLKGEEILPEARILAVADTIEAMASHRPYRPGLGIDKALAEIEQNRGKLYFPEVADACLRLFREKGYRLSA